MLWLSGCDGSARRFTRAVLLHRQCCRGESLHRGRGSRVPALSGRCSSGGSWASRCSRRRCRSRERGESGRETGGGQWGPLDRFGALPAEIKPEVVTMENVPRLTGRSVIEGFLSVLREAGYQWTHRVVRTTSLTPAQADTTETVSCYRQLQTVETKFRHAQRLPTTTARATLDRKTGPRSHGGLRVRRPVGNAHQPGSHRSRYPPSRPRPPTPNPHHRPQPPKVEETPSTHIPPDQAKHKTTRHIRVRMHPCPTTLLK